MLVSSTAAYSVCIRPHSACASPTKCFPSSMQLLAGLPTPASCSMASNRWPDSGLCARNSGTTAPYPRSNPLPTAFHRSSASILSALAPPLSFMPWCCQRSSFASPVLPSGTAGSTSSTSAFQKFSGRARVRCNQVLPRLEAKCRVKCSRVKCSRLSYRKRQAPRSIRNANRLPSFQPCPGGGSKHRPAGRTQP